MSDVFSFKEKECLRLLKDYATYFAIDERYIHECNYHNNKKSCESHNFISEQMKKIKEEAEGCGWTETISVFR